MACEKFNNICKNTKTKKSEYIIQKLYHFYVRLDSFTAP
jgi:hypothetical protein